MVLLSNAMWGLANVFYNAYIYLFILFIFLGDDRLADLFILFILFTLFILFIVFILFIFLGDDRVAEQRHVGTCQRVLQRLYPCARRHA